jgi:hypothetical protein
LIALAKGILIRNYVHHSWKEMVGGGGGKEKKTPTTTKTPHNLYIFNYNFAYILLMTTRAGIISQSIK